MACSPGKHHHKKFDISLSSLYKSDYKRFFQGFLNERARTMGLEDGSYSGHGGQRHRPRQLPALTRAGRRERRRGVHDPLLHILHNTRDPSHVGGVGDRPLRRLHRPRHGPGRIRRPVEEQARQVYRHPRDIPPPRDTHILYLHLLLDARLQPLFRIRALSRDRGHHRCPNRPAKRSAASGRMWWRSRLLCCGSTTAPADWW